MLKLQPLIDRFVDDVLRAVRGASLDDLRDLLAGGPTPERVARSAARREKPTKPVAAPKCGRTAKPAERKEMSTARAPAGAPQPVLRTRPWSRRSSIHSASSEGRKRPRRPPSRAA
jgi:hypothetical protein